MSRKAVFFSISILLILAVSYLQKALVSANDLLDPRQIDGTELAAVPPVEETLRFFQTRIKTDPQDGVSHALLAEQYIRQARETGDAASYQRAEAALRESIRLLPNYALAKVSLASVYYAQHEFTAALELTAQVYDEHPGSTEALAILADTHIALGNYEDAETMYQALIQQKQTPPVLARLAAFEELKGNSDEALDLMRRAARDALQAGGTRESVAWYVLRVGDMYFNLGQPEEAGRYYEAALRIFDRYHLALAGLGKVSAAKGNYEAAISYYQQAINIIPQPEHLAALGDLYTLTDQPEQARLQYETVELIGKLAEINQQVYNRQLANFYSDHDLHVAEALRLAVLELESRRDIYGYDAAAWAQYKNGNFEEAQSLMKHAFVLGTRDARLYYHAGMIELSLGNDQAARDLLKQATAINPHFSILHAEDLRRTLRTLESRAAQ